MCSRGLARFILFATNILLVIAGAVLLGFGIAAKVNPQSITDSLAKLPQSELDVVDIGALLANSANLLIAIGCFLFIFCFLGCFGGCCGIKWMLFLYWVALLFIIVFEVVVIIYAAVSPGKMKEHTVKLMTDSFQKYKPETFFVNNTVELPVDPLSLYWFGSQTLMQCCGVESPSDYDNKQWNNKYIIENKEISAKLPPSCCLGKDYMEVEDLSEVSRCMLKETDTYHKTGCYDALENEIKSASIIPIIVCVVIIFVELISIASAIYLWRQSKDVDQHV